MKVYLAADHAGFELKEQIEARLKAKGYAVEDLGAKTFNPDDDYPRFAGELAEKVASGDDKGIAVCGSGEGVCIVANRVKGIRASLVWNVEVAKAARNDDDSNVLCLPARFIDTETAMSIVDAWLATPFSNADRHARRLKQIDSGG